MTSKYEHGSREWKEANKIEGDLEEDYQKQCGYSKKWLPIEEFSINPRTGMYFSECDANKAAAAMAKSKHKKSPKGKVNKRRYKDGESGKAAERRYKDGESGKAAKRRSNQSQAGKAAKRRYNKSDGRKISKTIYKKSASGKAAQKRGHESAAGKAARQRFNAARRRRRIEDRPWALDCAILCAAEHLISGERGSSPTFTRRTGWHHKAFLKHVLMRVNQSDFDWDHHGNAPGQWNLEHRIPRSAYDFSDPQEVKRCWAPDNVDVKSFEENEAKSDALLPDEIGMVNSSNWPKSWKGHFPDVSKRVEIRKLSNARMLAEASMDMEDLEDLDEFEEDFEGDIAGPSMEQSSSQSYDSKDSSDPEASDNSEDSDSEDGSGDSDSN